MKCPHCSKDTPSDSEFCLWCGKKLEISGEIRSKLKREIQFPFKKVLIAFIFLFLIGIILNAIVADNFKNANAAFKMIFPGTTIFSHEYPHEGGYTIRGEVGTLSIAQFNNESLYKYFLDNIPKRYQSQSITTYYQQYLNDESQRKAFRNLITEIKSKTDKIDDQARIAINFVQHIPYDINKANQISSNPNSQYPMRYPYQVLYDKKGICSEKSLLTAFLLQELGYGGALFLFEKENHMAVGIKTSSEFDYQSSGYAFVETTRPTIITYSAGDYVGIGKLTSKPEIIAVVDGRSLTNLREEYNDAIEYSELQKMGPTLDSYHFARMQILFDKYGINPEDANKPIFR
ncbi:MAG: hypothetical protein A4E37_00161 [Methanoregulaceae archaeon PtaB.Bin056]|nr:MAG: hypothetical protein A4E37_00161 [Methanoregulaceae archaeon PtaB.Bin056]